MSTRRKLPSIGNLLERFWAGEDVLLMLNFYQQHLLLVHEELVMTARDQFVSEMLLSAFKEVPFPRAGRPRKDGAVEAEAREFWRTGYQELLDVGVPAAEAAERMAHIIRQRWSQLFRANKEIKTKTITERFQRRPVSADN